MQAAKGASVVELPVMVIQKRVLLPQCLLRLSVGKKRSISLVEAHILARSSPYLCIFTARSDQEGSVVPEGEHEGVHVEGEGQVYVMGCIAKVLQVLRATSTDQFKYSLLVQGVSRCHFRDMLYTDPIMGCVEVCKTIGSDSDPAVVALDTSLRAAAQELLDIARTHPKHRLVIGGQELKEALAGASTENFADLLIGSLDMEYTKKQKVLECLELDVRLETVLECTRDVIDTVKVTSQINKDVTDKMTSRHREYILRQQLQAIKEQLGEGDEAGDDLEELQTALEALHVPSDVRKVVDKDLKRLKRMQPSQPEYAVIRSYLECVSELPWDSHTLDNLDVSKAQRQLDADHFGLDKVKQRIVEYLSVLSLRETTAGSILCLVGPPGVGKTSLGKSIAAAMGRKFYRLSLGGVHDEAHIRGHRRTYIGAMPGTVIQALRRIGVNNPVVLLDEIDKLGQSIKGGDPSAALLEVLDPEQNSTFTDHYLNLPFDLSRVFFIATANTLDTIPAPLLDRMEIIEIPGYTLEEKATIGHTYLVPKCIQRCGLDKHALTHTRIHFPRSSLIHLVAGHTREAGVRQLERVIMSVCRHVAVKVAKKLQSEGSIRTPGPQSSESMPLDNRALKPMRVSKNRGRNRYEARGYERQRPRLPGKRQGDVWLGGSHTHTNSPATGTSAVEAKQQDNVVGGTMGMQEESPLPVSIQGRSIDQATDEVDVEVVEVDMSLIESVLGPPRFESDVAIRVSVPGVATGMAVTSVGGELLFIESSCTSATSSGAGQIIITGNVGEVMAESARIALSWVRCHAKQLVHSFLRSDTHVHTSGSIADPTTPTPTHANSKHDLVVYEEETKRRMWDVDDVLERIPSSDIHVHVPAGAVPKDGPSAGVAIVTALVSMFMGVCADPLVSMTGEVTLRGLVLPVGGIKDKVLAAHRGGITRVILPKRNEKDLNELPDQVRTQLQFFFVGHINEALQIAFNPTVNANPNAKAVNAEDRDTSGVLLRSML